MLLLSRISLASEISALKQMSTQLQVEVSHRRAIKLKEVSNNKYKLTMEEFNLLISREVFQNQEEVSCNNLHRPIWVVVWLHLRINIQVQPKIQMLLQVQANRTLCNLVWILFLPHCSRHMLMASRKNKYLFRISSQIKIQRTKVLKKKSSLFKHINNILKDWKIKPKHSRRAELNQDP